MESNKIADDLCLLVPLIDVSSLAKSFPRKDRLSVWSNLSFRRKNALVEEHDRIFRSKIVFLRSSLHDHKCLFFFFHFTALA